MEKPGGMVGACGLGVIHTENLSAFSANWIDGGQLQRTDNFAFCGFDFLWDF